MAIDSFNDLFLELNFYEYHKILLDNNYYELLFPFLLVYALLHAALPALKFFRNKKTGQPYNSLIIIISATVALFGVSFEVSEGETIGSLMMVLFPNISAITIGILMLYLVGSMLNKNFFRDLFRKDISSYAMFAAGAVGLGAIVFYVGIAMGLWDFDPFNLTAYWNVILAIALLVLAIVFLIIEIIPLALLFFFVFGVFIYNSNAEDTLILELFLDPVIFIVALFLFLGTWVGSTSFDKKRTMIKDMSKRRKSLEEYGDDDSRIKDIIDVTQENSKKKWKEKYGDEEWDLEKK
jgi:hypothetical protein